MIGAIFKTMWLRLWRDRGAFVLAFLLPGVIFAVFAAIFSTASGGTLDLRVAMGSGPSEAAQSLGGTIHEAASFDLNFDANWRAEDVSEAVRLGQYDVGLFAHGLDQTPPFTVYADPARQVAASVLQGQVRQILAEVQGASEGEFFEVVSPMGASGDAAPQDQSVTYYIGATAILFLMFSAMQAANLSIEERRNGLSDRIMLGRGGVTVSLFAKLAFLTLIGTLQAGIICAVAQIFFDVPVTSHLPSVALACVLTAAVSASIALLLASLCGSQTQMHAVSTFVVLLFSAIGGSMVPRFMMPGWLQDYSLATPNYWVIEGFYGILARGQSVASLWPIWSVMFAIVAACLIVAALISHRFLRT